MSATVKMRGSQGMNWSKTKIKSAALIDLYDMYCVVRGKSGDGRSVVEFTHLKKYIKTDSFGYFLITFLAFIKIISCEFQANDFNEKIGSLI